MIVFISYLEGKITYEINSKSGIQNFQSFRVCCVLNELLIIGEECKIYFKSWNEHDGESWRVYAVKDNAPICKSTEMMVESQRPHNFLDSMRSP
jgi:hypothetical protein